MEIGNEMKSITAEFRAATNKCRPDQPRLDRFGIRRRNIEIALRYIETAAYSICRLCNGQIGKARLIACPGARLCVDCQGALERAKGLSAP